MKKVLKEGKRGDWKLGFEPITKSDREDNEVDLEFHTDFAFLNYNSGKDKTIRMSFNRILYFPDGDYIDINKVDYQVSIPLVFVQGIGKEFSEMKRNDKLRVKASKDIIFFIHKDTEKSGTADLQYKNKVLIHDMPIDYRKIGKREVFHISEYGRGRNINEEVLLDILDMFKR